MNELKFKTNVNCNHCIAKITPFMDELTNVTEWNVDIANDDKIMTVKGNDVTQEQITGALSKAGYFAEKIN